jgi:hypothetical protein
LDGLRILTDRITSQLDQLSLAERAVDCAARSYRPSPVASRTYGRDFATLNESIGKRRSMLRTLQLSIEHASQDQIRSRLAAWWKGLATLGQECDKLFSECLAYAMGPLTRGLPWQGESLDGGLCAIGDEMLEELTVPVDQLWSRRTVLSDSEFIGEATQIIRLRFPAGAIWDLPVAAHEFGHLLGLGQRFRRGIEGLAQQDKERNWLHEFFADVFATYVLGPAFVSTCLLTRFDPSADPNRNPDTHPSDGLRALGILLTLGEMEETPGQSVRTIAGISMLLSDAWQACLSAAAPAAGEIEGPQRDRLHRWIPQLYELIKEAFPAAKCAQWSAAEGLAWKIKTRPLPPRPDDLIQTSIGAIVNAAWRARITLCENPYEVEQVSKKSKSWCYALIKFRAA